MCSFKKFIMFMPFNGKLLDPMRNKNHVLVCNSGFLGID